jgi:hypothetical protein
VCERERERERERANFGYEANNWYINLDFFNKNCKLSKTLPFLWEKKNSPSQTKTNPMKQSLM